MVATSTATFLVKGRYVDELSGEVKRSAKKAGDALRNDVEKPFKSAAKSASLLKVAAVGALTVLTGATAIRAARGIFNISEEMSDAAAAAEELQSKFSIAFEEGTAAAERYAETLASRVNRGTEDVRQSMADLQVILKSLDFPNDTAVAFSKTMAGLAIDISSFRDVDMDQAFNAIRSGATGITVPLKNLGIAITDDEVRARAMADGFVQVGKTLDPTVRAITTLNLLLEKTAQDQGDAERTADSFTNTMRGMESQLRTVKAEIGQGINREIAEMVKELGGAETVVAELRVGLALLADVTTTSLRIAGAAFRPVLDQLLKFGIGLAQVTDNKKLEGSLKDLFGNPTLVIARQRAEIRDLVKEYERLKKIAENPRLFGRDPVEQIVDARNLGNAAKAIKEAREELAFLERAATISKGSTGELANANDILREATEKLAASQRDSIEVRRALIEETHGLSSQAELLESVLKRQTPTIKEQIDSYRAWADGALLANDKILELEATAGPLTSETYERHKRIVAEIARAYDDLAIKAQKASLQVKVAVAEAKFAVDVFTRALGSFLTGVNLFGKSIDKTSDSVFGLNVAAQETSDTGRTLGSGLVSAFSAITPAINNSTSALERFLSVLAQAVSQALIAKSIGALIGAAFPAPNPFTGNPFQQLPISAFGPGGGVSPNVAFKGSTVFGGGSGGLSAPLLTRGGGGSFAFPGGGVVGATRSVAPALATAAVRGGSSNTTTLIQKITIQALDAAGVAALLSQNRRAVGDAFAERFLEDQTLRGVVRGLA